MKTKILGVALIGTMALSLPAAASDFYVLADASQSKFEVDSEGDMKESGFNVGAGYHFNDTFAIELAYRKLGAAEESLSVDTLDGGADVGFELEFTAVQASIVAKYPFSESFHVYGRVGMADIEVKATASIDDGVDSLSESETVSENKAVFGAGLGYAVSPSFTIRAEYSQFAKWEELKISTLSLGATYRF